MMKPRRRASNLEQRAAGLERRQNVADVSRDPRFQAIQTKPSRSPTTGCTKPGEPSPTSTSTAGNVMPDVFNFNDSSEAREAFPASRQASTSSGASVGEMNPGYPEEMQILLRTQAGWVKADPTVRLESAGLEQPDQPTDRSVRVGQPHATDT